MKNDTKRNNRPIKLIDRICLKECIASEHQSIKNTQKVNIWKSVSKRLADLDKRVVSWFFAMASSISLLIAAQLDLLNFDYSFLNTNQENIVETKTVPTYPKETTRIHNVYLSNLDCKRPTQNAFTPQSPDISLGNIAKKNIMGLSHELILNNHSKISLQKKFSIKINGSLAVSDGLGLIPEIGISVPLLEIQNGLDSYLISTGLSSQMVYTQHKYESNTKVSMLSPHFYVNLEYEKTRGEKNLWGAKIGYLLNRGDSSSFGSNTVKASVYKNVNNTIKIGPELIFTNNFRRVYPGIALMVSS